MATQAQIDANRANATHSTGPKSDDGKAASSANSFKHGLESSKVLLPGEDPALLDALRQDLIAEHAPVGVIEGFMVQQIATNIIRLQRAQVFERDLAYGVLETGRFTQEQLALASRYLTTAERSFSRSVTDLRKQQAARRQTESHAAPVEQRLQEPIETAQPIANVEHTMTANASAPKIEIGFVPQNRIEPSQPHLAPAGQNPLSHAA